MRAVSADEFLLESLTDDIDAEELPPAAPARNVIRTPAAPPLPRAQEVAAQTDGTAALEPSETASAEREEPSAADEHASPTPRSHAPRGSLLGLAAATLILVAAGVVVVRKKLVVRAPEKPSASASAATSAKATNPTAKTSTMLPTGAVRSPTEVAPGTTAMTATGSPAASAATDGGAPTIVTVPSTAAPSTVDPATLGDKEGLLIVETSGAADVYVSGRYLGVSNQPLKAPCGSRFVGLAPKSDPPKPIPTTWLANRLTPIPCKAQTTTKIDIPAPKP